MASPFKIPKKKTLGDSDSVHLDMQSPLSRLQSSTPQLKSYGLQSSRMHTGSSLGPTTSRQSTPGRPAFSEVVQRLFELRTPNRGASTANGKAAGGCSRPSPSAPRAESSSSCYSNGWRPKRASDRLLQPDVTEKPVSPPPKKKSLSPPSKRVSVKSPDSLAEQRDEQHARNSSTPGGRTWRREESSRDAAEKSDAENSPEALKQQRKNSSEDGLVSPSRTWKKPSAGKSLLEALHRHVVSPGLNKRPNPDRCDDPRERERQKWKEFRENRSARRSAVLQPRLKKPKPTPTEPIVLSSEDEEEAEDEGDGGERTLQSSSSRLEESSRPGNSEQIQLGDKHEARPAPSSRGQTDGNEPPPPPPPLPPPPSFLQLQFASLHAGLAHIEANGEMIVTETDITIPLKGSRISEDMRLEGAVTVVASQVRGYGVWDGGVAQDGTLLAGWRGPTPSLLFLWVSDAQANLLQRELSAIHTSAAPGPPCSFLLLVLKEQLQELQAALLASILDMEEYRKGYSSSTGPPSPLEWTDGLLLFHSCPSPLDQHLLGLLGCSSAKQVQVRNRTTNHSLSGLQQLPTRLIQYPPPPCKGRITVTKEDLACLDAGEFLNDVIIDFYLKFLLLEGVGGPVAERSHVFSSFFYKQLSRRRAAGESDTSSVPDRHTRHQRVKTWTRHVDIFTKDFLFVPVNQEAHWFLVVVCFPGLEEVQYEEFQSPTGGSERAAGKPSVSPRSPQPPECTQQGWHRDTVLKRPCILVLDSLKLSYHENVCRLLRDYLQVEWEVRRGKPRLFTPDGMRSSNCRVAQQDNSSDCGVFLLQYAESFLQNPVVHFDLPLRLEHWFPQQRVRQKRKEIRSLIMAMRERQSGAT